MEELSDFPKIYCPFIRKTFSISKEEWAANGKKLGLRTAEVYLVINKINPGYEWVIDDKDTIAVEKLNGTNVKLKTEDGRLVALQNRKNIIDPLQIMKGKTFIIEGIFRSIQKGYVEMDGEQVGEVIGPKLQGNPYKLDNHEWYPFDRTITSLTYKSFHEHPRDFENWSNWFHLHLRSRYYMKAHKCQMGEADFAEGVIFYNLKRRDRGEVWRAKLRRDMFDWFYKDNGITVPDYNPNANYEIENQENFE